MNEACPDLEALFADLAEGKGASLEHAKECPACSAMLEEHAEMEKELFRLSDPLPPASFVPGVMARIAASPQPARRELWAGMAVLSVALTAVAAAIFSQPDAVGHFGVAAAEAARNGANFLVGFEESLSLVWRHAAIPVMALASALLMGSLFGLRKLAGATGLAAAKVAQ
jgi:predicted anti-sigma-YlaC factor YlaD